MSRTIKQALSLFLCAALLFGVAPLNGFDELEYPFFSSLFASKAQAADPTSGTCGENLTWNYDTSTKTLTISGTGAMNDYGADVYSGYLVTEASWRPYFQSMVKVVIGSGVTSIGEYAFFDCKSLISVTIPNGVTSIGEESFGYCNHLTNIYMPASVTSIDDSAYAACDDLTNVYYSGSEYNKERISISNHNDNLLNATWHYNYIYWYTLSYSANGGTGEPSNQTGATGYTINSSRPRRGGYNFIGWSKSSSATSASYSPGDSITITADTVLYAVWSQSLLVSGNNYNVPITYGGQIYYYKFTPSASGNYVLYSDSSLDTYGYLYNSSGVSQILSDDDGGDNTNFRLAYSFTGGTTYYFGVKYYSSSAVGTISVKFGPVYSVSYNANGGSGAPSAQEKDYGKALTLSSSVPSTAKSYTISYNANGGTVSPASKTVNCTFSKWNTNSSGTGTNYNSGASYTSNSRVTLYAQWSNPTAGDLATPSREKYTFDGWYTSADGGSAITSSSVISANTTVYAHWTPIPVASHTVTYNYSYNGGSSATKTTATVEEGTVIDLTPTATKSGWEFVGWNTNKKATSKLDTFQMGNTNITLYAIYKKTLTATFISYSSTENGTPDIKFTVHSNHDIYNNATSATVYMPTSDQGSFSGWSRRGWAIETAPDASPINNYEISENTTFYSLYERTLTLSYNANGGSSTPASQTGIQYVNSYAISTFKNPSFTLANAISKSGATFSKWSVNSESGTQYNAGESITVSADTTMYAVWNNDKCGENLSWSFDDESGKLSISGNGTMYNFDYDNQPWYDYRDYIQSVYISNDVTSIGDHAFDGCKNLSYVWIGTDVTSIGVGAFDGCSSIEYIYLINVTRIDNCAFANCTSLNRVWYTGNILLTYIGNGAFMYCSALASVELPDSVETIGDAAFFHCENLKSVAFGKNIKTIGCDAFLETTLQYVFYAGTVNNWEKVDIDQYNDELNNADIHYSSAGGLCGDNLIWHLDLNTKNLTISGNGAMWDFSSILVYVRIPLFNAYITIPVPMICTPFGYHDDSIKAITIANGVTSIGQYAFYHLHSLESVSFSSTVVNIESHSFLYCSSLHSVSFPSNLRTIGESAFSGCSSLTNISFGNKLNKIGESAFSGVPISSIHIPSSVNEIGVDAFLCGIIGEDEEGNETFTPTLFSITVDTANSYYSSENGVLYNKSKTELIQYPNASANTMFYVPDSVWMINLSAFDGNYNLEALSFGTNVRVIKVDSSSFPPNLKDIYYGGTESDWTSIVLTEDEIEFEYMPLPSGDDGINVHFMMETILGDVNNDGDVDSGDATLILRYDAGLQTLSAEQLTAADVNKDGDVDSGDATLILRYDAGLITSF